MSQLIQISKESLKQVVAAIANTPWEEEITAKISKIQMELQKPCLVAVCGEARVGKSTFVNAFLDVELAKTGVTETTSILTYFKHGSAKNNGTVICHWNNGRRSVENLMFVHTIQGHDEAAMKKAAAISHIEIYIDSPTLKNITLVDTPGSGSLVATHEHNSRLLLQDFSQRSDQLIPRADAVIYLLGHVGKLSDSEFIKAFRGPISRTTNPMNAIGVMSKIDRSINILNNRWRFANDVLHMLPDLNTVIPVSALLEKTLKTMTTNGRLQSLQLWLQRIPPETCEELLEEREFFDQDDSFDNCPYSPAERRKQRNGIQWTVFQLIARTLLTHSHSNAMILLQEYAGFTELRKTLKTHFIERAQLLKCSHAISQVHHELMQIYLYKLNAQNKELMARKAKIRKFTALMNSLQGKQDMPQELVGLIKSSESTEFDTLATQDKISISLQHLEHILDELIACNDDFAALQLLKDQEGVFSQHEVLELTNLFGRYGLNSAARLNHLTSIDPDAISQRQIYWQAKEKVSHQRQRIVVEQAIDRYSRILYATIKSGDSKPQVPASQSNTTSKSTV